MYQENLGQSLWMTMHATTLLVVESPAQVVTALRIVEREERCVCECVDEWVWVRSVSLASLSLSLSLSLWQD